MDVKLQVHAAADEVFLQHAASPRGSVNPRRYRLGTEHRDARKSRPHSNSG